MFKNLFLFCLLVSLVACAGNSRTAQLSNQQQGLREILSAQTEQMEQMEQEVQRLNRRIEDLEFMKLARKDAIVRNPNSNRQNRDPDEFDFGQEKKSLDISKPANTSAIVPVAMLLKDESLSFSNPAATEVFQSALQNIKFNSFSYAQDELSQLNSYSLSLLEKESVLFWEGIASEAVFDNKAAVAKYAELTKLSPDSTYAAESLLRQSSIFFRTGERELARLTLQKVIADFPNTIAAERAKRKLKN